MDTPKPIFLLDELGSREMMRHHVSLLVHAMGHWNVCVARQVMPDRMRDAWSIRKYCATLGGDPAVVHAFWGWLPGDWGEAGPPPRHENFGYLQMWSEPTSDEPVAGVLGGTKMSVLAAWTLARIVASGRRLSMSQPRLPAMWRRELIVKDEPSSETFGSMLAQATRGWRPHMAGERVKRPAAH